MSANEVVDAIESWEEAGNVSVSVHEEHFGGLRRMSGGLCRQIEGASLSD